MSVTISRLFDHFGEAQKAARRLQEAGVPDEDISLIANNADKWYAPDLVGGASKGAAIGAGFGGVGGLLAGLGLLAVPGLGPMVAAGWLAAAATGAAAAGAAGGVVGMLAEAGVATNEAEVYAESLKRGGSFVSARVPEADRARLEALLGEEAVDVARRRHDLTKSGWSRFEPIAEEAEAKAKAKA